MWSRGLFLKTDSYGNELWRIHVDEGVGSEIVDIKQESNGDYVLTMTGSGDVFVKCYHSVEN